MKVEQITSLFKDLETDYMVDEWKINGVPLWPFIRIENYYLMSLSILSKGEKVYFKRNSYLKQILVSQVGRLKTFFKEPKYSFVTSSDVVFLSDGVSYTKIAGKWFDKFYDPLNIELQKKGLTSQKWDLSYTYLRPQLSPSKFIQFQVDINIIKSRFASKIKKSILEDEVWSDFDQFIKDERIKKAFINIPTKTSLRVKVFKILSLKNYYKNLLKKANPYLAYIVCYYGDQQLAFIMACKELGISTIDLQHGVQGEHHLAYSNWKKVPENGFECLPDYFFVWSEKEKMAINSSCSRIFIKKHQPIVKGNLLAEFWKNENETIVKEFDKKIQAITQRKIKPLILLTLSPHTENIMEPIWEVMKVTQYEFDWWIRLHPSMANQKKQIENILNSFQIRFYNIREATDFPLYSILRNTNVHITVQSSTVIEATYFNVPSIVTSEYGKDIYAEYINNSKAVFASRSEDIKSLIQKIAIT